MSIGSLDNRAIEINLRQISITASSSIEARRVADALPAALEHAFAADMNVASGGIAPGRHSHADVIAADIVRHVKTQMERGS